MSDETIVNLIEKLRSRRSLPDVEEAGDAPVDEGELAMERLMEIGADALPELCVAVGHKDWVVRYRAARALGSLGLERAMVALVILLSDTDSDVQAGAWDALALVDPRWEAIFQRRNSQAELVDLLSRQDYIDIFMMLASRDIDWLREATQEVFGRIGRPEVIARHTMVDPALADWTKLRIFRALQTLWQRANPRKDFEKSDCSPDKIYKEIEKRGSEALKGPASSFLESWKNATLNVRGSSVHDGRDILLRPGKENRSLDPHELLRQSDSPMERREAGSTDMSGKRSILSRLFSFGLLGQGGSNNRNMSDNAASAETSSVGVQEVETVEKDVATNVLLTSYAGVIRHQRHRVSELGIPDFVSIPAGEFLMGDDDRSDNPRRTVFLDAYHISKYPVTVQQYMAFVKSAGHRKPVKPSWGWQDDHPIVNLSWDDATAYCQWLSMKTGKKITLPTEAQWEKASRGTDGRRYPWGEDWDNSRLQCSKKDWRDAGGTAAVGSYVSGASPYGVLDMAGNVWEWCSDWYDTNYMRSAPTNNPTGPKTGLSRVLRGGSWLDFYQFYFRCAYRYYDYPDLWYDFIGFRCAVPADSP